MREKDVERGAFFSEPVDPVALGIPTYHTIVSEPMDLRTLHRKMEAEEVETPEDFARLCRLVFENAMTFNVDPTHSVHQAARNLLILFNQKFRDVERMVTNIRRLEREGGKKFKDDKKRKRGDEPKSLKRMRLEEAQDMAAINARSLEAIIAAASSAPSTTVSRNEFSLMLQMMRQLEQQVVQTYTALAELSSDDLESGSAALPLDLSSMDGVQSSDMISLSSAPDKKLPKKNMEEPKIIEKPVVEDDSRPLTLAEQELLTDTINELHADHLHGVIHIIREAAKLTGEEDEIDLEIDQLDTATQRQLLRHVSKVSLLGISLAPAGKCEYPCCD
jgi:bromodomain-containing factor 1